MSSQLIRSPKSILLLRKQLLYLSCGQYYGRSKIGKREVVGFGLNGEYSYLDAPDIPMPAIRFREEDAEMAKLREKERGDWKQLSLEDKKKCTQLLPFIDDNHLTYFCDQLFVQTVYRFSFCRTYAEMQAPTGEWKSVTAGVLAIIASAFWLYVLLKKYGKQLSTNSCD